MKNKFDESLLLIYDFAPNRYFWITDVRKGRCCLNIRYSDDRNVECRRNKFYFKSKEEAEEAEIYAKLA